MNLSSIALNPYFSLATGVVGGVGGAFIKSWFEVRTSDAKRRQDLVTHFGQQIETLAPSYYLMSNHASLLSVELDRYLTFKQNLQMTTLDTDQPEYKDLAKRAEDTAAGALFEAGKLYRVMTDRFWNQGGIYLVPDGWANESLESLHNNMMQYLIFDSNILLTYIKTDTERHQFLHKLQLSGNDPALSDLHEQYEGYKDWVLKQDKELKLLAANARAYSDLFSLEMKRLYKDVWGKTSDDPLKADEVIGLSSDLPFGSKQLIEKAAQQDDRRKAALATLAEKSDAGLIMAEAFLNVGWGYYEAHEWDLAIVEFKKALAVSSHCAAAYHNLGKAYTNKGEFDTATAAYQQASQLDPHNPFFKHNYGRMLSQRGDSDSTGAVAYYQQAVDLFTSAIDLGKAADEPDDGQQALRYNDLGGVYLSLSRLNTDPATTSSLLQLSIEAYGEAIVRQPLAGVLYSNLAVAYEAKYYGLQKSDPDGATIALKSAAGEYRMAARVSSGDEAAGYERSMALSYKNARHWKESEESYQLALSHFTSAEEKIETTYQLALMYQAQGDWNAAADTLVTALDLGGNKNSRHANSLIYALDQSANQIPAELARKAIDACHAAIEQEPAELDHHKNLGNIYFRLQDYLRFTDEYDKVVRLAENQKRGKTLADADKKQLASYYNQLALGYKKQSLRDMAAYYYQKAIGLDDAHEYLRNYGLFLQGTDRFEEALGPLERARAKGPRDADGQEIVDVDILVSLAQVYAYGSRHDPDAAMDLCRSALNKNPKSYEAHYILGNMLVIRGEFVEAADEYRKGARSTTDAAKRVDILGKGVDAYDRAIANEPDRVDIRYGRAQMLVQLGRSTEAEEGFLKAQELAGDQRLLSISIQDALGHLLYDRDSKEGYEGAKTAWEKALAVAADLSAEERAGLRTAPFGPIDVEQITNNLGTAYDALGMRDKAVPCYEEAARNSPETFAAHYNLAKGVYQQKHFDRALSQFQEALRLGAPSELYRQQTQFRIGNCFYRLNCKDLALDNWQQVARPGAAAEAHYNIGVLMFGFEGKETEAGKRWDDALAISPSLLDAEYNLGVLGLKLGNKVEAIKHWQAIAGKPGFESLAETIEKVEGDEKLEPAIRDIQDALN